MIDLPDVLRSLFKQRLPDLVTGILEREWNGTWKVTFVGEGKLPADSDENQNLDSLVDTLDQQISEMYMARLGTQTIGLQYAIYPWGTPKSPKDADLPTDSLVFDIQTDGAYQASLNGEPTVQASADTLDRLPDAVAAAVRARWPGIGDNPPPAVLAWNRTLTSGGLEPYIKPTT